MAKSQLRLEQMQSDPEVRALVETFLLDGGGLNEFDQGRGWAWEEDQRRKREQEKKRLEGERLEE